MPVRSGTRAVADLSRGMILASVEIEAKPERVFAALASDEIAQWWGSPELYRVTKWTGELRPGGAWRSEGVGADGKPFAVGGEYLEIDPPRVLVHTWKPEWIPGPATTVRYQIDPIPGGSRVTVRHEGFVDTASCDSHAAGWERVLGWLKAHADAPAT
jgi:uncharacterized protein YndB with AHSA1/START domain